jgi:hypothetical protein
LCAINIACLVDRANVFSYMNFSKDSESLCAGSSSQYILSLKSKIDFALLTLRWENLRFVAFDLTDLTSLTFLVSDSICGTQWVDMSLSHKVCLSHISVVVCGETSRVLAFLMSEDSLSPWNIIYLISFLGLSIVVPVFLGACTSDVSYVHLIANELRWGNGTGLNLWKVVGRRKWVVSQTVSRELDAFG